MSLKVTTSLNKQIRASFDNIVDFMDTVATSSQITACFSKVCDDFFSSVDPVYELHDITLFYNSTLNREYKIGDQILLDELGFNIGTFVVRKVSKLEELYYVFVQPLDYEAFKLDHAYLMDFNTLARLNLELMENRNNKIVESAGIEMAQDINQIIDEFKEKLQNKYPAPLPLLVAND